LIIEQTNKKANNPTNNKHKSKQKEKRKERMKMEKDQEEKRKSSCPARETNLCRGIRFHLLSYKNEGQMEIKKN